MRKGLLIIAVLAVAAVFLFGCTSQQNPGNLPTSNTQGAANAIAEQQQYEEQIASMNSELDDLNSIINDPEMDKINFVQLDENAFK